MSFSITWTQLSSHHCQSPTVTTLVQNVRSSPDISLDTRRISCFDRRPRFFLNYTEPFSLGDSRARWWGSNFKAIKLFKWDLRKKNRTSVLKSRQGASREEKRQAFFSWIYLFYDSSFESCLAILVFFRSFFLAFENLERFLHFINQWGELAGIAQLYVETPFYIKLVVYKLDSKFEAKPKIMTRSGLFRRLAQENSNLNLF